MMQFTLDELLEQTHALHNHICPRQVLGVRMGMLVSELLSLDLPQANKRLVTFVETDGCFADGIAVATGCWLGHRTIRLMDFGKIAATFVDTKTDRAFRVSAHRDSRIHAKEAQPDARSHWHGQLEAYKTMPVEKLLEWKPVTMKLSMEALISRPVVRTNCVRCGEEIVNEREVMIDGEPVCRACAGEAYYAVIEATEETPLSSC